MILLGLGANLPSPFGPPRQSLERALQLLDEIGIATIQCSPWYGAVAVPVSDQPDFVNGVVHIKTSISASGLMNILHDLEQQFGRISRALPESANAARPLDLDLLAYHTEIIADNGLTVPHPRMHLRAFVLAPLCDIAPDWLHPVLRRTARQLYQDLGQDTGVWRLQDG